MLLVSADLSTYLHNMAPLLSSYHLFHIFSHQVPQCGTLLHMSKQLLSQSVCCELRTGCLAHPEHLSWHWGDCTEPLRKRTNMCKQWLSCVLALTNIYTEVPDHSNYHLLCRFSQHCPQFDSHYSCMSTQLWCQMWWQELRTGVSIHQDQLSWHQEYHTESLQNQEKENLKIWLINAINVTNIHSEALHQTRLH